MSVASLGTTTTAALDQAQSVLQGHHGHKVKQAGGTDLLAQITARLGGGIAASSESAGTTSSLGKLGNDVLSILGIGGGTSSPATAASAYAASQNSI